METTTAPYWTKEFPGAITVCDAVGVILEMNDAAAHAYQSQGGRRLIGSNLLACHPEPSRSRVEQMLASGASHVYTIEKGGGKKLVYQGPWYLDGRYQGLVEMVLDLPDAIPHFVREAAQDESPAQR